MRLKHSLGFQICLYQSFQLIITILHVLELEEKDGGGVKLQTVKSHGACWLLGSSGKDDGSRGDSYGAQLMTGDYVVSKGTSNRCQILAGLEVAEPLIAMGTENISGEVTIVMDFNGLLLRFDWPLVVLVSILNPRVLVGCWEVVGKMMGVVGEWWSGLKSRGGGAVKVGGK
uniref:Uncharacterized protein n=1 Tax=Tanacetum cinerariifolium TaxID=118510 RepID=A0A6L2N8U5_TANCI|nr:hypothetical protein [Tanacetum cinerariifolium]